MTDILDDIEAEQHFSDREIFTKIWTSPRMIFKYIHETNYDNYVTLLFVFAGISRAFDKASMRNMGETMSLWAIIGLCIVIGGLVGWVSFYIYGALVSWTGKWLKGEANIDSIVRVIAYASIPSSVALLMLIPQIGIYGNEIFKSDGDTTSAGVVLNLLFYSTLFLEFVLGVWTIVLCVIGVSEVQKFSIIKSILNLLMPVLVIIVPILIIESIIKMF